jgi:hypothetical protein
MKLVEENTGETPPDIGIGNYSLNKTSKHIQLKQKRQMVICYGLDVICSQDFIYCRLGPQHGDIGGEETTKM